MRIIHTADLHLESKMESNLTKDQAAKRRSELIEAFETMVEYGANNGVEAILISGDMFDKASVRKTAIKSIFDIIKNNPGISFMYLKGNHDCDTFDTYLATDAPDNIYFFDSNSWMSYEIGDVVITGREINDSNSSSLYSDLVLDVAKFNIVMLHGQESNYDGQDKTHVVNIKALKNKYIDYLALGHIHKYKMDKLDERGIYCYPGCLEPRGFDECGKKGFVLLNIDDGGINTEFISLQKRMFIEKEIEITPEMDMQAVTKKIEEDISDIPSNDLLKLVIIGYTDFDRDIDTERIYDKFSDRFYFLKVYDKTKAHIDYNIYTYDRSLKGSFVRLVQKLDLPDEKKSDIIETGIRAIMGEEL